jgi:hypothetical protein
MCARAGDWKPASVMPDSSDATKNRGSGMISGEIVVAEMS